MDKYWEQRKLKEISNKVTEKNKKEVFKEVLTNSAEFGIVSQESYFEKEIANIKNISGYYVVRPNDFVYNPRISKFAPVGPIKKNKLSITGIMSPLYYVFRTKNIYATYLQKYFESTYWHKFMYMNGDSGARSDRFAIKDVTFNEMPIPYPVFEEQKSIVNFISELDRIITLHQRKINILESQKKEYLNVMFSNNHYNPPLVRFRGFYENWSNNKLSNYLITSKLKNLDGFYGKKDVLSVSGVHGVVNQIKLQGRSFAGKSVLNYRVLNNEEIVYTKSPLKVAPHGIIKTNKGKAGIVSTLYAIYKTRENTNPNFVQTYFENELRLNKYLKPLVNKGAKNDMKVTDENVLNGLVSFPSLEEQMKISLFAERIENLIEVNQIQLNTIKRLKESYLRKMFL